MSSLSIKKIRQIVKEEVEKSMDATQSLNDVGKIVSEVIVDSLRSNEDELIDKIFSSIDDERVLVPSRYEDLDSFSDELFESVIEEIEYDVRVLCRNFLLKLMKSR